MKLAILGCGKMTGAMLQRWLHTAAIGANDVIAVTRTEASAHRVAEKFGVPASTDAVGAIAQADIVLLGIKPQQVATVLPSWRDHVRPNQLWLSVLAGTTVQRLEVLLGPEAIAVRLMPNTPVRLGLGATAVVWPKSITTTQQTQVHTLLGELGEVVVLPEDRIDAFTAIAGSGPAYVFLFIESLAQAAVQLGFDPQEAERMALGVVRGASQMAAADTRDAATLRAEVTSPGGMTQAAIAVFEQQGWPAIATDATRAAVARAAELAS